MNGKPKRRTRERILETSLRLFNAFGEPNVTTTAIADELGISPGNLYYHFHSKDEIVEAIFAEFERQITALLSIPSDQPADVEDIWFFLHLLFEQIGRYRFFYRDLDDLLTRNRTLETHFRRLIDLKEKAGLRLCKNLAASGALQASSSELATLATSLALVTTYWLPFAYARNPRQNRHEEDIGRGVHQTMSLFAPFLIGDARRLLEKLSAAYLSPQTHPAR